MKRKFEIYVKDLKPHKQCELYKALGTSPDQENWDVFPIAIVDRENTEDDSVKLPIR